MYHLSIFYHYLFAENGDGASGLPLPPPRQRHNPFNNNQGSTPVAPKRGKIRY